MRNAYFWFLLNGYVAYVGAVVSIVIGALLLWILPFLYTELTVTKASRNALRALQSGPVDLETLDMVRAWFLLLTGGWLFAAGFAWFRRSRFALWYFLIYPVVCIALHLGFYFYYFEFVLPTLDGAINVNRYNKAEGRMYNASELTEHATFQLGIWPPIVMSAFLFCISVSPGVRRVFAMKPEALRKHITKPPPELKHQRNPFEETENGQDVLKTPEQGE